MAKSTVKPDKKVAPPAPKVRSGMTLGDLDRLNYPPSKTPVRSAVSGGVTMPISMLPDAETKAAGGAVRGTGCATRGTKFGGVK
jgi:hypothetical protein